MAQPLLTRLKRQDAQIHVLAPPWSAPLLRRMSEVTEVIESPFRHGDFDWRGRRALGHRLALIGFDEAYILPNSWKSALVPYFAGIPRRVGWTGEMRFGLLNDRRRLKATHGSRLVDRYLALSDGQDAIPRLTSTPEQQTIARMALHVPTDAAPIIFCPGAEYGEAKRWPVRHYAELARLLEVKGEAVWLIGSESDRDFGERIAAESCATNLCGQTTLDQAIDLIAGARAVICNDSGLMHVTAALNRPLVALFGSSSAGYTPPLSPKAKIVSLGLPCSPCFKRQCPDGHLKCLTDLLPTRVFAVLQTL